MDGLLLHRNSRCRIASTCPDFLQCVQTRLGFVGSPGLRHELPGLRPRDLPFLAVWLVSNANTTNPLCDEFLRFRYSSNRWFWMASSFMSVFPSNAVTVI